MVHWTAYYSSAKKKKKKLEEEFWTRAGIEPMTLIYLIILYSNYTPTQFSSFIKNIESWKYKKWLPSDKSRHGSCRFSERNKTGSN